MNANELKKYIIENNKIQEILEKTGCHDIKEYLTEYRAALPDKTNNTTVTVKKDNLFTAIRSSAINTCGDIFCLIMALQNVSFGKANKILHSYLGLEYSYSKRKEDKEKPDILDIFKKACRDKCIVNQEIDIYDDKTLKEYINMPHISWIKDGIMPFTCKRFSIGYSYDKKRIIIPWRYWCGENENQYVGIVGRTVIPNFDELGIPKYFGVVPFQKGMNLYGLYENYETIQSKGYVVVFESEKSVLKRYSRKDGTGVAIGCHSVSDEQAKILVGLNVDIILAFDEDVKQETVWQECEKFRNIRNISYIWDKWGLLKNKESPADKPNKQYEFLLKHKTNYDNDKHKEYLKCLKERQVRN